MVWSIGQLIFIVFLVFFAPLQRHARPADGSLLSPAYAGAARQEWQEWGHPSFIVDMRIVARNTPARPPMWTVPVGADLLLAGLAVSLLH